MKKFCSLFLSIMLAMSGVACGQSQSVVDKFNFDFENITAGKPDRWNVFGSELYSSGIDSTNVYSGKYSAFIESAEDAPTDFKAFGINIPGSYEGREITLTGYLKTENVTEGHSGLWMRIEPNVAFDNMSNRGVIGTTEWNEFKVTLKMSPKVTTGIALGGLLVGRGKMWIDGLRVTIDGKDISGLLPFTNDKIALGSGVEKQELKHCSTDALYELGLIWGFLKYYHPAIAAGNYDWDQELFKIIPQIIDVKNKAKRHAIFAHWIESIGAVEGDIDSSFRFGVVKTEPDLDWIENSGFSKQLVASITKVKNSKRNPANHYVYMNQGVGNPQFNNEHSYGYIQFPDAGFQILSLYRYWNMIQYFFPYKHLIGEDWKGVLKEFIPSIINAENKTDYLLTSLELIARVNDTHANIWSYHHEIEQYKGLRRAAPAITFIENKAVVTGFYDEELGKKTAMQIGDVIVAVNGRKIEDIVTEKLRITPASNYPTKLRDIARDVLRSNEDSIIVSYLRGDESNAITLETYEPNIINPYISFKAGTSAFEIMPDNIAYLYPELLKAGEIEHLWENIKDTKGLIVDLRCYPSDFIVFSLGEKLMPNPIPFVKFSYGSIKEPGLFTLTPNLPVGKHNPDYYKGKIVILINEMTQSQAEYTALAFRVSPNAVVVGSTTAGADGNVSQIVLPGDITTMISGIGVYYPDGTETQRVGIVPDIELKPTIKGITEGRDELLEKAVELIK